MTLSQTLDALAAHLERASAVPFSQSCMVNRAELLALVERARGELPMELDEARHVLERRDSLLEEAQREAESVRAESEKLVEALVGGAQQDAEGIVDEAHRLAGELVATSTIITRAQRRAEGVLAAARAEAARLLREADEYCDRRLSDLEAELDTTLGQVRRGRDLLRERRADDRGADLEAREDLVLDVRADERRHETDPVAVAPVTEVCEVFDVDEQPDLPGAADGHTSPDGGSSPDGDRALEGVVIPPSPRRVLDLTELEAELEEQDGRQYDRQV